MDTAANQSPVVPPDACRTDPTPQSFASVGTHNIASPTEELHVDSSPHEGVTEKETSLSHDPEESGVPTSYEGLKTLDLATWVESPLPSPTSDVPRRDVTPRRRAKPPPLPEIRITSPPLDDTDDSRLGVYDVTDYDFEMTADNHLHDPASGEHRPRRVSIASDPVADGRRSPFGHGDAGALEGRRRISVDHLTHHDGVRRKSILHNGNQDSMSVNSHHSNNVFHSHHDCTKTLNGELSPPKKYSMTESLADKIKYPPAEMEPEKAWWYGLCRACRRDDTDPSWQPPFWERMCPYPFCPTYRKFARVLALFLVGLLSWGVVYSVLGDTAGPGGQLFALAFLSISAHFGGWLITLTTLPALIGMLMVGILFQNVGLIEIHGEYMEVVSVLRRVALVIILIRAGLDLDPSALNRLRVTVLKLGIVPWVVEAAVVAVMTHFLLGLPWLWGFMLGSVIAAVSPAVVVPCLFRLRGKGYGVAKGIPTLIIAVSGIDDATSVAIFGIIHSVMFSTDSLTYQIFQGPLSIIGGVAFGVMWGYLSKYVPEKHDPFVVPLRILMLFGGGLIAVLGSESIGFGGAGPLACITAAFVSCYHWSQQGWEIEDNPVATAFEIFWMIFEPILFGLTGTQIKISELDPHTVTFGLACLVTGIIIRIIATVIVAIGGKLNLKEKLFVAISWMSKATVQAALGPVALDSVRGLGNPSETGYAEMMLMICVLSILLTAPTGAILITLTGPRLLKKTTHPAVVEGWRRSARPSLRDISIIDEEEDGDGVAT